jgi:hypothetical protein
VTHPTGKPHVRCENVTYTAEATTRAVDFRAEALTNGAHVVDELARVPPHLQRRGGGAA